jgi:hypothetical protein
VVRASGNRPAARYAAPSRTSDATDVESARTCASSCGISAAVGADVLCRDGAHDAAVSVATRIRNRTTCRTTVLLRYEKGGVRLMDDLANELEESRGGESRHGA